MLILPWKNLRKLAKRRNRISLYSHAEGNVLAPACNKSNKIIIKIKCQEDIKITLL